MPSDADHDAALLRRIEGRYVAEGQLVLPAVPGLLDHYVGLVERHFQSLARRMDDEQIRALRALLDEKLQEAFDAAPQSNVFIRYGIARSPGAPVRYEIASAKSSLAEEYGHWVDTRVGSLFGKHPDAKVMDVASSLGPPGGVRVLDVGAGTGRNTLPLARRGHPTVALELAPALTDVLADAIERSGRGDVHAVCGDVFDEALELPLAPYQLVIVAEVVPHLRDAVELGRLLSRLEALVAPGGSALLSAFLAKPGYAPTATARQIAQVQWSSFFLRDEIQDAARASAWELVSEEPVLEYERARLPPKAWPPTRWFESWASGSDAFDVPMGHAPIELRWLVLRRAGGASREP